MPKWGTYNRDQRSAQPGEFEYRDPVGDNQDEAIRVLDLIVAEFISDPMSVQCFDLRVVERAKQVIFDRQRLERRGEVPPLLTEGKPRA